MGRSFRLVLALNATRTARIPAHRACAEARGLVIVHNLSPRTNGANQLCRICHAALCDDPGKPGSTPAHSPAKTVRNTAAGIASVRDRLTGRLVLIHRACLNERHFELQKGLPADIEARSRCTACGEPLQPLERAYPVFFQKPNGRRLLAYAGCFNAAPERPGSVLWRGTGFSEFT